MYIRTLPEQGYQFIAPVQIIGDNVAAEIDASMPISPLVGENPTKSTRARWFSIADCGVALTILVIAAVMYLSRANAGGAPNLAVLRFDAETSAPSAQKLADNLTDDVVVQLASRSGGHYRVIGNASILREPRGQRDLAAIASMLHCKYAVLGQVRADGNKVLILAHLIRLSDLTHIEVVRMERNVDDPMTVESDAAAEVAARFAAKMAEHPERAASFPSAGH